MRVLVAGATGAMGRQLVPRLVRAGHEVHGMTRSESKQALLQELGAVPVVADALDPEQVARAVATARPEVVVHELTSIGPMDMRHFDRAFAQTNRLRTEGTDHLLSAARAAGVGRFVAQSFFAGYDRVGGGVKTEDDPFGTVPPPGMEQTVGAIRYVEDQVLAASWTQGLVLRYGGFYGPHTSLGPDGEQTEAVRRRKFPIVGDGGGVWSFIHIADAADATVAAVERGTPGAYNVVDDEPRDRGDVAADPRRVARGQGTDARAAAGRTAPGGRDWRGDDDRAAGRVQRQGPARAGLGPRARDVA